MIQLYSIYKRFTLAPKTQVKSKRIEKHTPYKQGPTESWAMLVSDKIDLRQNFFEKKNKAIL